MAASAQRLTRAGVKMEEFPQSVPNLTAASQNLYELIKGQGIAVYPDDDIRLAVNRAIAVEGSRGWKIAKEKQAHKIDIVVALAMAALAAVQKDERGWMRVGGCGYGGPVHWHEPPGVERPRIRYVMLTEQEDLKRRGLL
jgi:phage terminase large subunit-like protein